MRISVHSSERKDDGWSLKIQYPLKNENRNHLRPQGGGQSVQKSSEAYMKDLGEMQKMLKTASKNIFPSPSYDLMKIAQEL